MFLKLRMFLQKKCLGSSVPSQYKYDVDSLNFFLTSHPLHSIFVLFLTLLVVSLQVQNVLSMPCHVY
jgi:hypothetical protein